jgi:tyrosine-protein kinase Etk/Wzc
MTDPMHNPTSLVEDDEIDLLDLVHTMADNIRLLIVGPLVAGLAVLGYSFLITPTFTANTTFLPPQQQQSAAASMLASLGGLAGLAGGAAGIRNPSDQYIAFMQSRLLQDALIERFNLMERFEAKNATDARNTLSGAARISAGKDGLINVQIDDADPAFAAELANAYVEELKTLLDRLAVTEAQQRRVYFGQLLEQARDGLAKAEEGLKASGIDASTLMTQPQAAITQVAQLQAQITSQEVKLASMRGFLTEAAPEFRQAMTELQALRAQLRQAEAGSPRESESNSYVARFREYKYQETLLDLYTKQYEAARLDESREGAVIQVLDVAIAPDYKSKPKKALMAVVATLAAGFALLLFVFVRQALRNSGQNPESAAKVQAIAQALRNGLGLKR